MIGQLLFGSQDRESVRLEQADLVRVERKIDLLLEHAGLTYNPYAAASEAVAEALRAGHKIEAIKIYRAETGAGLREAKEYVEAIGD